MIIVRCGVSKVNKTRKCPSVQAVTEADPANLPAVRNAQGGRLHGQVLRDPQRRRLLRWRGFSLWAGGKSILRKYLGKVLPPPPKKKRFNALAGQQQGWSLSVELVIGGRGIRQRTQKDAAVSKLMVLLWRVNRLFCSFYEQIQIVIDTILEMVSSLKRFINLYLYNLVVRFCRVYIARLRRVIQVRHVVCPSGVAVAS